MGLVSSIYYSALISDYDVYVCTLPRQEIPYNSIIPPNSTRHKLSTALRLTNFTPPEAPPVAGGIGSPEVLPLSLPVPVPDATAVGITASGVTDETSSVATAAAEAVITEAVMTGAATVA